MKQIWKYIISPGNQICEIPIGAKILCVKEQSGVICFWAEVEIENQKEKRNFTAYGTGRTMGNVNQVYIGSVNLFTIKEIYHVYEILGN